MSKILNFTNDKKNTKPDDENSTKSKAEQLIIRFGEASEMDDENKRNLEYEQAIKAMVDLYYTELK